MVSPASVGFAIAVSLKLLTERYAIEDVLLFILKQARFLVEFCQLYQPVIARSLAHDVSFVGQCDFEIAFGHFVVAFGKDSDVAHHAFIKDSVYVHMVVSLFTEPFFDDVDCVNNEVKSCCDKCHSHACEYCAHRRMPPLIAPLPRLIALVFRAVLL
nr:MAG TPA: hypothetical protein [Microviridae sp.]